MTPYDLLFADQALDELVLAADLPAGSRLDVARSRMWEGRLLDVADAAAGGGEPWATFILSLARIHAGQSPERLLRTIAEDAFRESRARLFAWTALRKAGVKPNAAESSDVMGCVVEVPVDGGIDVLAAYADGSTRFIGHADQLVAREAMGQPSRDVAALISEAYSLLLVPPAPRDPEAPGPSPGQVRLSALGARGIHTVVVPDAEVAPGGRHAALFKAATLLLVEVTTG